MVMSDTPAGVHVDGFVFQWEDADGKIWQVEAYGPNSGAPPGAPSRTQSTLRISQLETNDGKIVTNERGYAVRTVELNGQTGEWVNESELGYGTPSANEALIQAVHIRMEDVTADMVGNLAEEADMAGVLTNDFTDYGVAPPADTGISEDEVGGDE